MTLEETYQARKMKDEFFRTEINSPLNDDQKALFEGLIYYDYDPALAFNVKVTVFESQETIQVFTTQDGIRNYRRYGEFSVTIAGEIARLTIYETPYGFFLPFIDANAGKETYPAGRYLDLDSQDGVNFYIDFNTAYNPLCAYSPMYDCPITPKENRLQIAIPAGEKIPVGDWVNLK